MLVFFFRMSRQIRASNPGYHAMSANTSRNSAYATPPHVPPPHCRRCSYKQPVDEPARSVRHHHFSMKAVKEMTMNSNMEYYCPSCMKVHGDYMPTDRVKVLLTSSLLNQYWAPPQRQQHLHEQYRGDLVHIDHVGIPGATVDTLTQAFRIDYEEETRGIDIVAVAYYNDFINGATAHDIMRSYYQMLQVISNQASKYHPTIPNSLAVATLPYPPQLCWFPDNGPVPTPHYVNHLGELTWLNDEIKRFNVINGTHNAPTFHKYGDRIDNRKKRDRFGQVMVRHTRSHRWEDWREPQPQSMLHLCDRKRMMMGKAVANYFLHNTWD